MSTHMHSYTYTAEQWGFHKRQAGKQPDTHSHVYNVPYKRDFFFSSFLSRLNKQTWLSHSLYSCADFCVSVCFNLNGFQVPSLPKSASSFSPLIQQLTLKLSSFSLFLLFLTFSQPSRDITVCHLSLSTLHSCSSLCSQSFPPCPWRSRSLDSLV